MRHDDHTKWMKEIAVQRKSNKLLKRIAEALEDIASALKKEEERGESEDSASGG